MVTVAKKKIIRYNRAQIVVDMLLQDDVLKTLHTRAKYRLAKTNAGLPKKLRKEVPPIKIFLEWARGTGKSTIIARFIRACKDSMPRGLMAMVAESYQQILTRTLPSTIQGLEMQGLYKDVHYFVGRRAPIEYGFQEAYQPPLKYDHAIHFHNGFTIVMISQDKIGDGRGLNVDCVVGDEAALLDWEKLQADTFPANRGSYRRAFKDCPLHRAMLFASSTPLSSKGDWFIDQEKKHNPNEMCWFIKAKSSDNTELPPGWIEEQRELLDPWVFDAEIMNIRPKKIKGGFYPQLNPKRHYYAPLINTTLTLNDKAKFTCLNDSDYDTNQPILLGIDWGYKITCVEVGQRYPNELRIINSFAVETPKILDDVFEEIAEYYAPAKNRTIIMYYDNSGNINMANTRLTYAQQAQAVLTKHRFTVLLQTKGKNNKSHALKYNLTCRLMKEEELLPKIRINSTKCGDLIISMERAPAKENERGMITKNKSSEVSKVINQRFATHHSDAFDTLIDGLFSELSFAAKDMPLDKFN